MDAERFFFEKAGWSYRPSVETAEEGRSRGAGQLARAEAWLRGSEMYVTWEPDWDGDHSYDGRENVVSCEWAALRGPLGDGEVLASLGCIDDATDDYRRVVEAELALEVMSPVPTNTERVSF